MNPTAPSPRDLQPARALRSPLFLVALVTLAVNDHLLKGSGLLPGWLTGKLSDLAGLVVLPVVLSVVFRVRRRTGVAVAVTISVAFLCALKLSPDFSRAWTELVGHLGLGWQNTVDPTDVLAVVVVLPFWRWVVPAMQPQRVDGTSTSWRPGEALVLAASSIFLVATSQPVCANFTESVGVVPNDTPPQFPGSLTGTEILARLQHAGTMTAEPKEYTFPVCPETAGRSPTQLTLSVDAGQAVTRHDTVVVDATKKVDTGCAQRPQGTTVTVTVPVSLHSADGTVAIDDTFEVTQTGSDGGVAWSVSYFSDAKPGQLKAALDHLALTDPAAFVGVEVRWSSSFPSSLNLIRAETYETCTALSWTPPP